MALRCGMKFPEVLWHILNDDRFTSIYWSEDGTSVLVREQDFIEEVLEADDEKKVFQTNSFASFIRNLNFYGFACRRIGTENNVTIHSCFCPYFQRDRPELRCRISRGPNSRRWMALFDTDGTPKEGVEGLLEDLTNQPNKRRSIFTDVRRDEEFAGKFVRIAPKAPTASTPAALLLGNHNISNAIAKALHRPTITPHRLSSLRPPSPSLKRLVHDALEIPATQPDVAQPVVLMPQQQQTAQPAQLVYMLPVVVPQCPVEMATTAVQTTTTFATQTDAAPDSAMPMNMFTEMPMATQTDLKPSGLRENPPIECMDIPNPDEGLPVRLPTYDGMLHWTCEDVTSTGEQGRVVLKAARNQARTNRVLSPSKIKRAAVESKTTLGPTDL